MDLIIPNLTIQINNRNSIEKPQPTLSQLLQPNITNKSQTTSHKTSLIISANPDSIINQGQFHSNVPRTRSGHQLGQQIGNEAAPEFRAKTSAPGTAPEKDSHHTNPIHATPGQTLNLDVDPSSRTGALDAFPGSTSQSVHNQTQYGQPIQGRTRNELHGIKAGRRKSEHPGLEGVGATAKHTETVESQAREQVTDKPEGIERGIRGVKDSRGEGGYNAAGAEHSQPETVQRVATESASP